MTEGLSAVEKKLEEVIKRLDAMDKRLTVAEDIEQIKQVQINYLTGHTLNDGEREAEGFADDATFLIGDTEPLVGKEAITKFAVNHAETLKAMSPNTGPYKLEKIPADGHFILHPLITVDGDKAKGTWMQYCLSSEPVTMQLLYYVQALFDVEYIKRDGKWQIYWMKWTPRSQPRALGAR